MGYETNYYGRIDLSSKEIKNKIEQFEKDIEEDLDEYFEIDGIEIADQRVEIGGYGKIYLKELEKFCLFIAKIDKGSYGVIECNGEDSDDLWRIVVGSGEVEIQKGVITYREDGEIFEDNSINKDIYKITKDKELLKEIIVEELNKNGNK